MFNFNTERLNIWWKFEQEFEQVKIKWNKKKRSMRKAAGAGCRSAATGSRKPEMGITCESNMEARRTRRTSKTPGLSSVTLSSSARRAKPGSRLANSTTSRMAGRKRSEKSCSSCVCWPPDGAGVGFSGQACNVFNVHFEIQLKSTNGGRSLAHGQFRWLSLTSVGEAPKTPDRHVFTVTLPRGRWNASDDPHRPD